MGLTNKNCEESEIDLMPDGWKTERLGQLVRKFVNGGTPTTLKKEYWTGNIPWISGADVVGQKVNIIRRFITKDAVENSSTNVIQKGNLLVVSRTGVGKFAIAPFDVAISQDLTGIYTDERTLLPEYLFRYLDFKQKALHTQNQGTSIQGITRETLSEIRISLPDTSEQTAIVSALSDTDALIENLEKLIAKKRNIKQGVMQEVLTGRKRLTGFNGSWKEKKLGDIGKTFGGLSGKSKKDFEDGKYPYIPFLNILNNPIIDCNFFDYVNLSTEEKQNKAYKGDLFFNGSSETPEEVGMCSVLLDNIPNLYLNSFCFGFRLFSEELSNGMFLSYYFRSKEGRKLIYSLAQGATRYNLSKTNFLKLVLRIPEPEEQEAIANVLVLIDKEIHSLEQKLYKYQMIKQGMMQTLLTGKIRLI